MHVITMGIACIFTSRSGVKLMLVNHFSTAFIIILFLLVRRTLEQQLAKRDIASNSKTLEETNANLDEVIALTKKLQVISDISILREGLQTIQHHFE
ncbi:uncharacterized protein LOC111276089 isoform X4 [Durio zibethinus]|uniref:Uncharacterized protein LOC111276089 isoform X4 n=1 Tax=Durio zibethinus TaxID=66656 RepID=A0A6P5WP37_DURZI|nr:uncharacterized protein LOC111276089 isoform X4 [Durio zibethinus]